MFEDTKTVAFSDLQDGRIVLEEFPGAADNGIRIEARIKYQGFESWSPWVSTQNPVRYRKPISKRKLRNKYNIS